MTGTGEGVRGGAGGRTGLLLFLFFLALYLLTGHGYLENPDSEVNYQTTRALVLRGDPAIVPELGPVARVILEHEQVSGTNRTRGYACAPGLDGRYYAWFGLGHALWNVPFYVAGRALAAHLPELEGAYAAQPGPYEEFKPGLRGEEYLAHLAVSLSYPLAAALVCWVLYGFALVLGFRRGTAITLTLIYGLACMAWPFSRESLSDGPATLFALLCLRGVIAWERGQRGDFALLAAGLAGAAMVAIRPMLGLYLLPICLYLLLAVVRRQPGAAGEGAPANRAWPILRRLTLYAAPLAVTVALLMAYNHMRFGNVRLFGYHEQYSVGFFSFPPQWGLLFQFLSPGKGFLLFNLPLLGLLLLFGARRRPRLAEALLFLLLPLCIAVPCAFTSGWHSGQGWGMRYLLPALGPLVLLAGYAWEALPRRSLPVRALLRLTVVLGLAANLGGVASPVHGWLAGCFEAVRQTRPELGAHLESGVYVLPRYSPILGGWLYLGANVTGRLEPGGSEKLARWWWGDGRIRGKLPPRSVQLMHFNHLWWVDGYRRFGCAGYPVAAGLLALTALLAGWSLRRRQRTTEEERAGP